MSRPQHYGIFAQKEKGSKIESPNLGRWGK